MREISRQRRFREDAVKRVKSVTLQPAKPEALLGLRTTEKSSPRVFLNSESPCFRKNRGNVGVAVRECTG